MKPLGAEHFPEFFREVNGGNDPFPWQERLARKVFESGKWPECLDLPTASGKTAVLDIAIFHLALQAGAEKRTAPLRIAFVVDRRLIVDQAHERAKIIQCALKRGEGVAGQVAAALKSIAGEDSDPLVVQALRGGLPRESEWARTPVQPTVLLSTVDQVGSRLLFRGYGVSKSMRPVHAGLLGSDCLIFLDEAHLSEPFRQSLGWIGKYRQRETVGPWGFVTLSATPGGMDTEPFRLEEADREHPVLGKRLKAEKRTELREMPGAGLAENYASAARELRGYEGIKRVLVVVNRVDLARNIFEDLKKDEDAILLTGCVREIDRGAIVDELEKHFKESEKFFVVATQCIEAGVDRDFDGLVTQIAPIDALRQRFGRLNRTGRDIAAKAIILAAKEEISKKPDPIYGETLKTTWDELKKIADSEKKKLFVDFGALALVEKMSGSKLTECSCKRKDAPVMPPAYVDLWTCTNPQPSVEADVALFLHGAERASADVEIVWRADITEDDLKKRAEIVALVPPRLGETMSVPVWKVRDWLGGKSAADLGDFEGGLAPDREEFLRGKEILRWRDGEAAVIRPHQIRAGDVIVVPASYGGSDKWGWTGEDGQEAEDKAFEVAARLKRSEIAIRLHKDVLKNEWDRVRPLIESYYESPKELLAELKKDTSLSIHEEVDAIRPGTVDVTLYDEDDPLQGLVLTGKRNKKASYDASTEDDRAGSFGQPVSLRDHTNHVVEKVVRFAAGLPENVRTALEIAAKLHDTGKGDGRFQSWLRDGLDGSDVLAKSGRRISKPTTLPDRWRHEALSVRVAIDDPEFCAQESDVQELALWLIGTHHGWGRPFFPHKDDMDKHVRSVSNASGGEIRLDASAGPQQLDFDWNGLDWASLFDRVQGCYGPWELARYESILRLADHRASEDENA